MSRVDWRDGISRRLRFEIFNRDKFSCQYCGRSAPEVTLHVDHIHPVSAGGDNSKSNLISSCSECNFGKRDRLIGSENPSRLVAQARDMRDRYESTIRMKEGHEFNFSLAIAFWTQHLGMGFDKKAVHEIRKATKRYPIDYVYMGLRGAVEEHGDNAIAFIDEYIRDAINNKFDERSRCLFGAIFQKHAVFPAKAWLLIIELIFRSESATLEQMMAMLDSLAPNEFTEMLINAFKEIHSQCVEEGMPV